MRRKAQKKGRTPRATAILLADWVLLLTMLAASAWPLADVLRLYRARWQVELVFKRMKQLLRLNQIRSTNRASVEATVRALLVAWALQEGAMAEIRAHLPTSALTVPLPMSRQLVADRAGARHPETAGTGHLVAGPAAGVPPALTPLPRADTSPPGASGNGSAGLAHRRHRRMLLSGAEGGIEGR